MLEKAILLMVAALALSFTVGTLGLLSRLDGGLRISHFLIPRFDRAMGEAARSIRRTKPGGTTDVRAVAFLVGLGGLLLLVLVALVSLVAR